MRRIVLAGLLVLAMAAVPPAAADNPIDGFVVEDSETDDCLGGLDLLCNIRDGTLWRLGDTVTSFLNDRNASTIASDVKTTFNDHAGAFQAYANHRLAPDQNSSEVMNATFVHEDTTATVYLTTDVVNGSYTNTSIVSSTDRAVDETCVFRENAATNSASEVSEFHSRFVEPNESITSGYMTQMATRYGGNVNCTFTEDT